MENKREIRTYGEQYQPRLRENADGSASRTIEGYAIVFGVQSVLLQDWYDTYREIIEPGAITEAELATMDIKMTMYHNREKLLARSNKALFVCQSMMLASNMNLKLLTAPMATPLWNSSVVATLQALRSPSGATRNPLSAMK